MDEPLNEGPRGKYSYRDYRHILRLGVLVILGFSGSLALRYAAVPETYYATGRYRGAAPEQIASRSPVFAGREVCAECHEDIQKSLTPSKHKLLACETCHWASGDHAANPDIEPRLKVKSAGMREFCQTCHERKIGRPAGFPQIDPGEHNPGDPCSDCHQPHHPEME